MLIQWTSEFSVGNEMLDNEHKEWIRLLNEFYEGIKEHEVAESLDKLIYGMIAYTQYHFGHEEKHMLAIHYPDYESHKEKHDLYLSKLLEFRDKIKAGKPVLALEVINYLKSWLVNHIKGSDLQYARFEAKNRMH
jgi:hemerythrin